MKKKLFFSSLFFLFLLEIGLRILGLYNTYSEKTGKVYSSYYGKKRPSWYFTWKPNLDITYKQPEFSYRLQTNSLGIREREFLKAKDSTEFRIFVLGDSFTEGDGASYEFAYPRILENLLQENCNKRNFNIYNAGVCGSDVLYAYTMLRDKILDYTPDLVLIAINNSDINDFVFRGGMERFKENGTTLNRKGPWYEKFLAWSHTSRMIVLLVNPDFDLNMMMDNLKFQEVKYQAHKDVITAIDKITNLCIEKKVDFAFLIHPFPFEIPSLTSDSGVEIDSSNSEIQNLIAYLPPYTPVINILDPMRKAMESYKYEEVAWPINLHYNATGYKIMGEVVYKELLNYYTELLKYCGNE